MLIPLISLDLETTGLDPAVHAPWEIAWCTAIHDTATNELHRLRRWSGMLELPAEARADPVGLDIGRFWERWRHETRRVWVDVQRFLLADLAHLTASAFDTEVHLIGGVPQFDHRMLERWLGWNHHLWHYHLIDVETLFAGAQKIPPPYSTEDLTARAEDILGVGWDMSHQHEAAADVQWNLMIYAAAYRLTMTGETP